ncbi:hypothetical protein [Streptomyces sp. GC420]|uniref:hypothetical protein n=1 Tax=Streptomyces sp. GC420 TaxID=2697568 RepID=UPI001414E817|nr:hypothetical protein [Streptomyces sp. GC420]NBM19037.1 hypothetical protein [Streptomyces sp. GC420]
MPVTDQRQPSTRASGTAEFLVTLCGRHIRVKGLWLGAAGLRVGRVALDVGPGNGGAPGTWAALSPAEARDLARLLLTHAALAEQNPPPGAAASAPDAR